MQTPFTERFHCAVPIQLAGMGGISTPELAAAVSNAGGLGMLAGVMMPPEILEQAIRQTRALTTGQIGVNFLMPFLDRDAVEVAARDADAVDFFYGDPDAEIIAAVHARDTPVIWQAGSVEEAQAAENAGADFVVAQGVEGGGHIRGNVSLFHLLDRVLAMVRVPVIAAGGIGTGRLMAAALAAGACAVRVGTRFVAAAESPAHPDYVQALIRAGAGDTELTERFNVPWPNAPHRVLRSSIAAAEAHSGDVVATDTTGGEEQSIPKWHVAPPTKDKSGDIAAMAQYAGYSVSAVHTVQPAADIVRELSEESEQCLDVWRKRAPATR